MGYMVPIVVEKTGRGEKAYDIFSRLLRDYIYRQRLSRRENRDSPPCERSSP